MVLNSSCLFCGSSGQEILGINPDFEKCTVFHCPKCSAIYSAPVPTDKDLAEIYESKYREIRKEKPTEKYFEVMGKRAKAQKDFLMPFVLNKRRCLDIGSGAGTLLEAFARDFEFLEGYEPDTAMFNESDRRRSKNVKLFNKLCDVNELQDDQYDLITLSHVFEHIAEPRKFLVALVSKLSASGVVFIEVPNDNVDIIREQCEFSPKGIMHLNYFNRKSFQNIFSDLCQIITIQEFGVSNRYFRRVSPNLKDLRRFFYFWFFRIFRKVASMAGFINIKSQAYVVQAFGIPNPSGIYLRIVLTKKK